MKPGDLVRTTDGWDLDFFVEPITQECPHPSLSYDQRIGVDDLLVVLEVRGIPKLNLLGEPDSMVRFLLPNGGTGWLYTDQLEMVE